MGFDDSSGFRATKDGSVVDSRAKRMRVVSKFLRLGAVRGPESQLT